MQKQFNKEDLRNLYRVAAKDIYGKELNSLNANELNSVIADVVKTTVIEPEFTKSLVQLSEKRIAIYFSIEFLIGRIVMDALVNCGIKEMTAEIFEQEGIDISILEDVEDTALGNGGLGRLAACFIESAATQGYPLYGVGLYYKYGLFKQLIENGEQVEIADDWTSKGEPWFEAKEDEAVIVEYSDTKIKAVPYIFPIIGYANGNKNNVYPLTMWKAEPIEGVTNENAAMISDYLYPKDTTDEGKRLRLRQEYFFVSATLQKLFQIHLKKWGTLDNIEDYYCFQMNDTHPVVGCVEFIRLLQQYGYSFDDAFEKARKCFAYTNHTIMTEALEKWEIRIFKDLIPDVFKVLEDMNLKLIHELMAKYEFCNFRDNGRIREANWQLIRNYELFSEGIVYMSRIACYMSFSINGVAAVHSGIIKDSTLSIWYKLYPWKFNNKTNGVTPRRWIKLSNPLLADFLDKYLGEEWVTNLNLLEKLEAFKNDNAILFEFKQIKKQAKKRLAEYILKKEGIEVDVDSIFDCQVKRIHEYKRQLMNALRILYIYDQIKKGNLPDFYKTTFIIGGKAAAGYKFAKDIISLIKDIQNLVNNDSSVSNKMKVVFLTNFNVSYGEKVYAGANFSEQISTAGTEASGTGNMKFMMNGAPTIGTFDGANIEIVEEASQKNNYVFGATIEELNRIKPIYNHSMFLKGNEDIVKLLDYLKDGRLGKQYWDIVNSLLYNDRYFIMYDLLSYIDVFLKANADYRQEQQTGDLRYYTRKCLKNTAHSGKFSSDRTIEEYAEDIWKI
ncbi:MAG: glycogen/starch/alpha-glucan phosphorylase [Clostridiales bacterium]|nr:glycogen/starch/alpha-glucan phosphorylase [Clostridiales bacterium]